MKKITKYLQEYRTPKRTLARMIGLSETYFHFYLNAEKYADKVVGDSALAKIAKFEGVSVAKIRREYEARKSGRAA